MKKMLRLIAFSLFIILLFRCEDEKEIDNNIASKVLIQTNKEIYSIGDTVIVEILNNNEKEISYDYCSPYNGIAPLFLVFKEDTFVAYWAPMCDSYRSFCCDILGAKDSYKDTIELVTLEKGRYKILYQFILEHGKGYTDIYSNEFVFE